MTATGHHPVCTSGTHNSESTHRFNVAAAPFRGASSVYGTVERSAAVRST